MTKITHALFAICATVLLPVLASASDAPAPHVYASIMSQVETGQIACSDYNLAGLAVGTSRGFGVSSPFSGEVRFRWQLAKNARNTGALPWVRTTIRYHERFWDVLDVHLAVRNDTEDGNFRVVAP